MGLPKRLLGAVNISGDQDTGVSSTQAVALIPDDAPLPKLPLPELSATLERYLEAVKPLVPAAAYERTCSIVKAFGAPHGPGPRLQRALEERRERTANWAYEWWLADMYLNNTLPLPVNSNPGMVFPPSVARTTEERARFAARMVLSAVRHQQILDKRGLAVERCASREKGQPLCMAQFYRLMTSVRNPGKPKDQLNTTDNASDHVVVACRNQFYVVQVRGPGGGEAVCEDALTERLAAIMGAPVDQVVHPIGILTTQRRDKWADARNHLIKDSVNRSSAEAIERALMVLCLDSPITTAFNSARAMPARGHSVAGRDETNMAHHMLHGGGSKANSANRWFDKTIQLVISSDGVCGLCYEHSPAEGPAVIQLMEKMLQESASPAPVSAATQDPPADCPPPTKLNWIMDVQTRASMEEAARAMDSMIDDLDFYVYRFNEYGKDFIKSCKVSPDVYIQLALQLTYVRLFGKPTATYESASTRRFQLGRVDCIRSATCEAWEWTAAMLQQKQGASPIAPPDNPGDERKVTFVLYDDNRKRELFEVAAKKQTDIMVKNILGEGIDIHLLGLREVAKELGESVPDLFIDDTFRVANHFALSTSQVATTTDSFMGYGPVVPDGYGASYNPKPDSIVFCLSAFHSAETTSTAAFARALERSLLDMKNLLQAPVTAQSTDGMDLK